MPSLPQRVMGYFRQLSFIAEPRDQRKINDGCFITKYLERFVLKIIKQELEWS